MNTDDDVHINYKEDIKKLRFSSINCRKCPDAYKEIKHFLSGCKSQIIALQEIPRSGKNPFGRQANYIRAEGYKKQRSALAVSRDMLSSLIPELSTKDITTALVHLNSGLIKTVVAVSIYLESREEVDLITLNKIKEYSFKHQYPIMLAGDTNARSSLWGYPTSNARALKLEEFLIPAGLLIAPFTDPTRRSEDLTSESTIDILAYSPPLEVVSLTQYPFPWSDHDIISVDFDLTVETAKRRNAARADWDKYTQILAELSWDDPERWTEEELEIALFILNTQIIKTFKQVCPESTSKARLRIQVEPR